eukprot:2754493-Rhodomonas_salina.3
MGHSLEPEQHDCAKRVRVGQRRARSLALEALGRSEREMLSVDLLGEGDRRWAGEAQACEFHAQVGCEQHVARADTAMRPTKTVHVVQAMCDIEEGAHEGEGGWTIAAADDA